MNSRFALALPLLLAFAGSASAQGFSPEEAAKRMKLPEGFSARCVASEPMIRQPTSISFDNRGRMWVLQYLQYPNYAGLKPVKQDQYLRTIWDKVPEPPPLGPKGADKITILYDPDEHGVFRKSKDFVTGLNIASGFCLGDSGVYVVQPPYLLFYPDKNEDDIPDGDPEVLLTGFGMDDTHSLANSLQFGPDGWLYGAAGSTSTCKIKNPNHPKDPIVEFQQGIWRFHPKTKKFELFSEGGGNTYGLDFDKNGQVIAGTNYGGFACLHQMQGAYYVKGFAKHGPLHNPNAYGYFEHIPYTGFKGGHVTCGGIIYQADTYPEQYRNQYIAANLLSNAVYWHKLEAVKSSFKASHGGELIEANDTWFRPVDLLQGPDGCVYVVDFYDKRAAHLDPVDNWDKTNGRIYRIEYKGGPKYETFDLRKKTSAELVELLKHPNVWYRREARELLTARRDPKAHVALRKFLLTEKGDLALEALWTLYASGGWMERDFDNVISHPNEYVRAWAIRFLVDDETVISNVTRAALVEIANKDTSPNVLAQLACSARRMPIEDAQPIVRTMIENVVSANDPNIPLLIWWVMEHHLTQTKGQGRGWLVLDQPPTIRPLVLFLAERYARRMMSPEFDGGASTTASLLNQLPDKDKPIILRAIANALDRWTLTAIPDPLIAPLEKYLLAHPNDMLIIEVMARMNVESTRIKLRNLLAATDVTESNRIKAINLLRQVRDPKAKELFVAELANGKSDTVKIALLAGIEVFDDPKIGEMVLASYPGYSPAVKKRAVQLLFSRPVWALNLLQAIDAGMFPKADVSVDQARIAVGLANKDVTALIEKHFGKIAQATAGEKLARISWLNVVLSREKSGDAVRGKVLFTKTCAACHTLHGEGGKAGPDLTTADRRNRGYLLTQIVDPSGFIRPEFVVQIVLTTDDRKLSGIAKEVGESVELTNFVDNKVIVTTVAKKDIADIRPSAISLMPEKLLDTMKDSEIADLFAYLASDGPSKKNPGVDTPGSPGSGRGSPGSGRAPGVNPGVAEKKLKVCLVSGSFEYKSNETLAEFQKYLEGNFPVECSRAFAKAEKDKDLAGIENLEKCDVAIFFTRRLMIEGDALDAVKKFVKSGKPIVGIRTASHGFQNWLEMDKEVFGGDYMGHFGPGVTEVKLVEKQKDHPILKGVSAFKTNGSLYKNPNVAADVTVLLRGSMDKESEPVAWVREKDGRRVFYTSVGHPDDFKDESYIRLLVNGLAWATKTELKPAKK